MEQARPRNRRCAIYTRKSSEEGLETAGDAAHAVILRREFQDPLAQRFGRQAHRVSGHDRARTGKRSRVETGSIRVGLDDPHARSRAAKHARYDLAVNRSRTVAEFGGADR